MKREKLCEHIHICVSYDMALWLAELAKVRGLPSRSVAARTLFQEAMDRDEQSESRAA